MLKKDNILINKIIKNSILNPNKRIIFDNKKSLTYSKLVNLAYANSKIIKKIKSKYIPIIVDRNINSVIAIMSVILSKKIFCPISILFQ